LPAPAFWPPADADLAWRFERTRLPKSSAQEKRVLSV
jgi:hypothetical protein